MSHNLHSVEKSDRIFARLEFNFFVIQVRS